MEREEASRLPTKCMITKARWLPMVLQLAMVVDGRAAGERVALRTTCVPPAFVSAFPRLPAQGLSALSSSFRCQGGASLRPGPVNRAARAVLLTASLDDGVGDSASAMREAIDLRDQGLIDEADFAGLKADILGRVAARAGGVRAVERTDVVSDKLFRARGPFSHVVRVRGAGDLVFTSTITALDRDWNVVGDTIEEQTRFTIEQLKICLAEAGASISDVVSVTWYLVDIDDMPRVAKVREEMFEGCRPASGSIPINKLLVPELMLELSAIAVLS